MAFNPFAAFQKNKRFWMAAILMICMVTFVFCTGMRGDMQERLQRLFSPGGPTIATINGRRVTSKELAELKNQRLFANDFVMICSEIAFRKLSKMWHDETVKLENEKNPKDVNKRRVELVRMQLMIETIAQRKNRPNHRFYDGGVKLDDLLEFKLWLAQADKMGIHLEDNHVDILFSMEFFDWPQKLLSNEELRSAQFQAMRRGDARDGGDAFVRKAITDEYRAKIAQYAVLGSQPWSYFARSAGKKEEERFTYKFSDPDLPDEIRAPMSPAQILEYFNKNRSQFDVTFIPIKVEDFLNAKDKKNEEFLKNINGLPNIEERRAFFDRHKNQAADPGSEEWGLERPAHIKLQYLMADPEAPGYKDLARLIALLKVIDPVPYDPMQSLVTTAARYGAVMQKEQIDLDNHHQAMISNIGRRNAALYSEKDFATPLLAYYAGKHPEAVASWIGGLAGASFLAPPDLAGATAGYLAWAEVKNKNELDLAIQSEIRRRTPQYNKDTKTFENSQYIDVLSWAITSQEYPLNAVAPLLAMDKKRFLNAQNQSESRLIFELGALDLEKLQKYGGVWVYQHPAYTTETIETEIRDILARNQAEEWAQANIREMRRELERAAGDPEKYKKALNTYLKNLKLTVGPPGNKAYDRFSVQTAPELEPLRKQFDKYLNQINWYEARDLSPDKLLKASDFYKMFFSSEKFAATGIYRAATWPPVVEGNNARIWKKVDPRMIAGIKEEQEKKLKLDLLGQDLNRQAATFDLFLTADKPILFWRTSESPAIRFSDYDKAQRDRKKAADDLASLEKDKDIRPEDKAKKKAELEQTLADLDSLDQRITEGWRLQHARGTVALTDAAKLAKDVIGRLAGANDITRLELAKNLGRSHFDFNQMSVLHADQLPNQVRDYSKYPMPKDKVEYPRDDMVDQAMKLVDLKEPIKIARKDVEGSKDIDTFGKKLDEVNKELFEQAKKEKKTGCFVQILTDKPRSTLYVAYISNLPRPSEAELQAAFIGSGLSRQMGQFRDMLVERSQQDHARTMRVEIVDNLKRQFNFVAPEAEARKTFDDRE